MPVQRRLSVTLMASQKAVYYLHPNYNAIGLILLIPAPFIFLLFCLVPSAHKCPFIPDIKSLQGAMEEALQFRPGSFL